MKVSSGMSAGDPDRDGEIELVFCDYSGSVLLLEPTDGGEFISNVIWQADVPMGSNNTLFDLVLI